MRLESDFVKFIQEIQLQENHRQALQKGHSDLRKRLRGDQDLKPIIVSDFSRSYRRDTRCAPTDARADVDIVLVAILESKRQGTVATPCPRIMCSCPVQTLPGNGGPKDGPLDRASYVESLWSFLCPPRRKLC
jgi:hypothetical protein